MSKIGALVRFYFNISLTEWDNITEEQLLEAWGQLIFALKQTGQMSK